MAILDRQLRAFMALFLLVALANTLRSADSPTPDQIEFFEAKIRPVLVEHCYECHNSDSTTEAEFALDWREPLRAGGQSGAAISAEPAASLLLQVMRHEIEGLEMPEGGERLSDAVLADFQRWIAMGAPDPRDAPPSADDLAKSTSWEAVREKRAKWWSFQPIRDIQPPKGDPGWSDHPIDQFTYRKMFAAGLQPAEQADRTTLARRVYFALTGLPPTPQQIDAFVNDKSDDAYLQLVDQLLDSPHFGERWARHWMDWIRYAQSHGSEGDPRIEGADLYRDYLIRAINDDVPYDQMVREHIAGDLLANPRSNAELGVNESRIATAHWRMVFHGFAPTDALDERVRFTDDAIDVVSKAFLGLTVSCARCHNHKFDAISQADYYALAGIVDSTRPGRAAIDLPARLNMHREALAKLKTEIRDAVVAQWLSKDPIATRLNDIEETAVLADDPNHVLSLWAQLQRDVADGTTFETAWQRRVEAFSKLKQQHQAFTQQDLPQQWQLGEQNSAGEWFAYGNGLLPPSNTTADRLPRPSASGEFAVATSGPVLRGIYPAGILSHLISDKHAGLLTSRDFRVQDGQRLWLQIAGDGSSSDRFVVQNYPRNGTVYPVNKLAGAKATRWHWQSFDLAYWQGDDLHIELATARDAPLLVTANNRSWFGIRQAIVTGPGQQAPVVWPEHLAPLFERAQQQTPRTIEAVAELYHDTISAAITAWQEGTIGDSQSLLLDACIAQEILPNTLEQLPAARPLVLRYRQLEKEIPVPRRAPTIAEWKGSDHPLYIRGDHKQPDEAIPRRFLEAIDATAYETSISGRRQFAEDLLRDENPFTARVIVNRLWHHLFGRGIVATADNFGRLGAQPTHPELLDYLATDFRNNGWSIKRMIRRIVTSRTWQQDSQPSKTAKEVDPENLLLSHHTTTRLEAEAIRDALLFVSGRLQSTPPDGSVPGTSDRRSVYVNVIRNALDPFLASFDAPVPFTCKGRRDVTNVPAQALMMLNNPFVIGAAERLARESVGNPALSDTRQRIASIWRRTLGTAPNDQQLQAAMAFLQSSESGYEAVRRQIVAIEADIVARRQEIAEIVEPARQTILDSAATKAGGPESSETGKAPSLLASPISEWNFGSLASDPALNDKLTLHGSAKLQGGALLVDSGGWAQAAPLKQTLTEKSLEVVVQLDKLEQQGGAAISMQTTNGVLFDAIVYAERERQRWMNGSDHGKRTTSFGGPDESDVVSEPVHLVITYTSDGTIACYRNGQLYGKPYKTSVQTFPAEQSEVIFGLRHGKQATRNRMLSGRIYEARLYDHALLPEQVQALSTKSVHVVSYEQIVATLDLSTRQQLNQLEDQLQQLREEQTQFTKVPDALQHWIDFAHSLLNTKEFIYVR